MPIINYTWECDCGYTKHSDIAPKECPECFNVGTFDKVSNENNMELEEEFEDED